MRCSAELVRLSDDWALSAYPAVAAPAAHPVKMAKDKAGINAFMVIFKAFTYSPLIVFLVDVIFIICAITFNYVNGSIFAKIFNFCKERICYIFAIYDI